MYARQMRLFIFILISLFAGSLAAADKVYKTVDEDGNIIFTDKPSEEAEEVKIKELETIKNPNPAKYKPLPKQQDNIASYESLKVTSPENGEGIRSNAGNITIKLALEPGLRAGHKIVIQLDGKEIGSGLSVSLQNVERGTHNITANVVDANGKKLISTSSSFSLLRASQ